MLSKYNKTPIEENLDGIHSGESFSIPDNLVFGSQNYFTPLFLSEIRSIIGSPHVFNKLSGVKKLEIHNKLLDLYAVEDVWKTLVKKTDHSNESIKKLFPVGDRQFKDAYYKGFFAPNNSTWQTSKKFGCMKACQFIQGFLLYLLENRQHFPLFLTDYPYQNIDSKCIQKLIEDIQPEMYFNEIVKICMKSAYEIGTRSKSTQTQHIRNLGYGDDNLRAKHTDIVYPLASYLERAYRVSL